MPQATGRARLALEALDELFVAHKLRRDQFQRHIAFRAQMRGQIDCAHAAHSQQPLQAVLLVKHLTDVTFKTCHVRLIPIPLVPISFAQRVLSPKVLQ